MCSESGVLKKDWNWEVKAIESDSGVVKSAEETGLENECGCIEFIKADEFVADSSGIPNEFGRE